MGKRPMICVSIVNDDTAAIKKVEPLADFFEVRIDLIGKGWREVAVAFEEAVAGLQPAARRRGENGGGAKRIELRNF